MQQSRHSLNVRRVAARWPRRTDGEPERKAAVLGQEEGRTRTREGKNVDLLGISAQLGTSLPSRKHR